MATQSASGSATDNAKEQVQEKAQEAQEKVKEGAQQAQVRMREQVDQRSTQAGEQVSATAEALRSVAPLVVKPFIRHGIRPQQIAARTRKSRLGVSRPTTHTSSLSPSASARSIV